MLLPPLPLFPLSPCVPIPNAQFPIPHPPITHYPLPITNSSTLQFSEFYIQIVD